MANGADDLIATLFPASPTVIRGEAAPSPFHFNLTGEDNFQIESWNSVAGVTIAVQGRMWTPEDGIKPFGFVHTPNSDRSLAREFIFAGVGHLLNLVVFADTGTPKQGQTFVSLHVVRGQGGAVYRLATIAQGYVTRSQELAYPGSPVRSSEEGGGCIRSITSTNPAANTGHFEAVPTGARWQLLAVHTVLTTTAAGSDRFAYIYAYDGAEIYGYYPSPVRCAPSQTRFYQWAAGIANGVDYSLGSQSFPLPAELILPAGHAWGMSWTGLEAGDDVTAAVYVVREWLEAA